MRRRYLLILCFFLLSAALMTCHAETTGAWTLTQYYAGGSVGMFYSIDNAADGTLILIDGGLPENAEYVRQIIDAHGGRVDDWILTHYHADHCGAFNELYPDYNDRIGTIYITPLTWEEYEPNINPWDRPEIFQAFLELTQNAENIVPLHRGDAFEIGSLGFTVYNAWDEEVTCSEPATNCSLMFKVTSDNTSVLFFGDVSFLSPYILEKYGGEALHAEYVQAGHHGWQVPMEVYEAIKPKEMFIDATDDLLNSPDYADKHGVLVRWCEENGVPIHRMSDAPFSIELN